jgi:hypothetical protein
MGTFEFLNLATHVEHLARGVVGQQDLDQVADQAADTVARL